MSDEDAQRTICARFGATFLESPRHSRLGIALDTLGQAPLNGLRHQPEGGTCGWYIWAGEIFSSEPEFFQAMHVSHLPEHCPDVLPYLGLGPGWRFLIAFGHEDVWFDESLLPFEPSPNTQLHRTPTAALLCSESRVFFASRLAPVNCKAVGRLNSHVG